MASFDLVSKGTSLDLHFPRIIDRKCESRKEVHNAGRMKYASGMTLYETLAPIYNSLFPVDPRAPAFLNSLILGRDRPSGPRVLDAVGPVATSSRSRPLAGRP